MAIVQAGHIHRTLEADVTVLGLGFVGLPLALSYARAGLRVVGADVDHKLVQALHQGRSVLLEDHEGQTIEDILVSCQEAGSFTATSQVEEAIAYAENILVTVGIPVQNGEPVYEPLLAALRMIGRHLKKGALIVLRSTVIPGTTETVALPILESFGHRLGKDFFLAYAPERIAEGQAFSEFTEMPTLVAGCDEESLNRAERLLRHLVSAPLIRVPQVRAAELSKVFENVQRDANIAISQVFARMCEAMDLSAWDVIQLANSHKRVNLLTPGPGVGGFCLPNAVHYLEPKARELGVDLSLLQMARRINQGVPSVVANKVLELLVARGKRPVAAKVAVIGLAMKDNSSDARLSPPVDVCNVLEEAGCEVWAFDPAVPVTRPYHRSNLEDCLENADALVLLTRQQGVELPAARDLVARMGANPVVVDVRNWFHDPDAERMGILVWRI